MTSQTFREHGSRRDTLVDYRTSDGEHVKVISGPVTKNCVTLSDTSVCRRRYTTRIWVNGHMIFEYDYKNLPIKYIPFLREKLNELAEERADSDEVVSSIDALIANLSEMDQVEIDEPGRFLEFE